MTTLVSEPLGVTAVSATVSEEALVVDLSDGRTISAPIGWYPRLVQASSEERRNIRLIGNGSGIHWPEIEEDISIASIIEGRPSMEGALSLKRWLASRAEPSTTHEIAVRSAKPTDQGALGTFELKKAANGQYMFNLRAANNEIILTSETYSSKAAAEGGIASVRKNAASENNFEKKTSSSGQPYFHLKSADNGQILGRSEMYSALAAMEKGIRAVMASAAEAKVRAA